MAFDFLGTFNRSQLVRLTTYLRAQLPYVEGRKRHLQAELIRVGTYQMRYDDLNNPIGYYVEPTSSYLGRLMAAYEVLGGSVYHDVQVRPLTDPVYLVKSDVSSSPYIYSNGEPQPQTGKGDAESALLVAHVKEFNQQGLHRRRGYLERKIRRVLDYADQLRAEVDLLDLVVQPSTVEGSFEYTVTQLELLVADPTYRAVYDDMSSVADEFGRLTGAPLSVYAYGDKRPVADRIERGNNGVVLPGASG